MMYPRMTDRSGRQKLYGAERNAPHFNTSKIVDKKTVDKRN